MSLDLDLPDLPAGVLWWLAVVSDWGLGGELGVLTS